MNIRLLPLVITDFTTVYGAVLNVAIDPNFHSYLLFGQSNMAGGGTTSE